MSGKFSSHHQYKQIWQCDSETFVKTQNCTILSGKATGMKFHQRCLYNELPLPIYSTYGRNFLPAPEMAYVIYEMSSSDVFPNEISYFRQESALYETVTLMTNFFSDKRIWGKLVRRNKVHLSQKSIFKKSKNAIIRKKINRYHFHLWKVSNMRCIELGTSYDGLKVGLNVEIDALSKKHPNNCDSGFLLEVIKFRIRNAHKFRDWRGGTPCVQPEPVKPRERVSYKLSCYINLKKQMVQNQLKYYLFNL